jgi:hypothetical protein
VAELKQAQLSKAGVTTIDLRPTYLRGRYAEGGEPAPRDILRTLGLHDVLAG